MLKVYFKHTLNVYLKHIVMSTVIAMKDLRSRLAEIADLAEQGITFTVVRRSKPSFIITPVGGISNTKKHAIEDLAGIVSVGNLANSIDDELYGPSVR
jgi:antitoxin (DNA-binding transcriptional repressor) of toxin-antitoxin stability system